MKRPYLIGLILILMSNCNSSLDDKDFEKHIELLEKLNSKLLALKNLDTLNNSNSLEIVEIIMGDDTLALHTLKSDLMLRDIKHYNVGGLEYCFGTGVKWDYEYYMLYIVNLDKKESFVSNEQYGDYQLERRDISKHWTFIKKRESN